MLAVLLLNNRIGAKRQRQKMLKSSRVAREESEIFEFCRTCLSTKDLVSIFYSKETERKRTEDLRLVTGLEIRMKDGLSQKICTNCIEAVNFALQFRLKSIDAEKKQLSILPKTIRDETVKSIDHTKSIDDEIEEYESRLFSDVCTNDHNYVKSTKYENDFKHDNRPILTENGTYKCHICDKEFLKKSTLRAHVGFHTNYCICEICGKRALNNNMLLQHKRARHGLARVHVCGLCDYSAATKAALTVHKRIHTGEKPYVCDHCGVAFHRRSNLVQHIPIHLPESNFECTICQKREKSKRLLQHHVFKVHRENKYRYICPVCHDVFKSPGSARLHLTKSHGVPRAHQGYIQKFEKVKTNYYSITNNSSIENAILFRSNNKTTRNKPSQMTVVN